MNPELCEVNNIIITTVNIYIKRFEVCKIVSKWNLVFDNDISIDVDSQVMYRISVLRQNLEKNLKKNLNIIEDRD